MEKHKDLFEGLSDDSIQEIVNIIRLNKVKTKLRSEDKDTVALKQSYNSISNTLTNLENEFNKVLTYTSNVIKIQDAKRISLESSRKENYMEQFAGGREQINSGLTSFSYAEFTENLNVLAEQTNTLAEKLGQLDLSGAGGGGGTGGAGGSGLLDVIPSSLKSLGIGLGLNLAGEGLDYFGQPQAGAFAKIGGDVATYAGLGAGIGALAGAPVLDLGGLTVGAGAIIGGGIGLGKGLYDYGSTAIGAGEEKTSKTGTPSNLNKDKEEAEKRIHEKEEEPKQSKVSKQLLKNAKDAVKVTLPNAPNSSATGGATQQQTSMLSSFTIWLGNAFRNAIDIVSSTLGIGAGASSGGMDLGLSPLSGVLDSIARAEGTFKTGYNTSLGNGAFLPGGKEQNLVGMSLTEVLSLGDYMLHNKNNRYNSSALGRYQIVGTTLRAAAAALGMDLNTTKFDATTQDKLAMWIIKKQGLGAWEGFKSHPEELTNAMSAAGKISGQINAPGTTNMTGGNISGNISSSFGMRTLNGKQEKHLGVDIRTPTGTPLYAASDGIIEYARVSPGGDGHGGQGLAVQIKAGEDLYFTYGHLSKLNVQESQGVKKGDLIGLSGGDTGDAREGKSTGAHLHFEIRKGNGGWGTQIDPQEFLERNSWIVQGNSGSEEGKPKPVAQSFRPVKLPNGKKAPAFTVTDEQTRALYRTGGGGGAPIGMNDRKPKSPASTPPRSVKTDRTWSQWWMTSVMGVDRKLVQ